MSSSSFSLTGKIEFSVDENQLSLLSRKLIKNTKIEALLSSPEEKSDSKKKVSLIIEDVVPKEFMSMAKMLKEFISTTGLATRDSASDGISRSFNYLFNELLLGDMWILFGHAEANPKRKVCIVYFSRISAGSYSFQKEGETKNQFHPQMN